MVQKVVGARHQECPGVDAGIAGLLILPVTDLLRFHYAGRVPDGKGQLWSYGGELKEVLYTETGRPDPNGKVWDSRHVGRWQLPDPFVPYIWVGVRACENPVIAWDRRRQPACLPGAPHLIRQRKALTDGP